MKRITLILGVAAVMAAMMVTLAAPAMADNNRQENRQDRQENRQDNRFNNHHNWFDNDRDNVVIRYDPDSDFYSDDFDSFYPYWGWGFYPYWGSYDDCGFDWDGPVTPADCWD